MYFCLRDAKDSFKCAVIIVSVKSGVFTLLIKLGSTVRISYLHSVGKNTFKRDIVFIQHFVLIHITPGI